MSLKPLTLDEIRWFVKVLLYGPEGEGKTFWVADNCPKPAVWIDFERSSDTIKKAAETIRPSWKNDIEVIPVTPANDPKEVRDFITNIGKTKFKTVCFDTLSTSQTFQLNHWMTKGGGKTDQMPEWKDYRWSTTLFSRMLMDLQHANLNVVIVGHEQIYWEGEGDARRKVEVGPAVTPALHAAVKQLVSGVIRLQNKATTKVVAGKSVTETKSTMLVRRKGLYVAKNRYGLLEPEIENPTWDNLFGIGELTDAY
jgi:hypothetical protein